MCAGAAPRSLETRLRLVCANAGIDSSNVADTGWSCCRPTPTPRRPAAVGGRVVVTDTHGRAFRRGLVNVAIGVAGFRAIIDHRGDSTGAARVFVATEQAIADELAAAAVPAPRQGLGDARGRGLGGGDPVGARSRPSWSAIRSMTCSALDDAAGPSGAGAPKLRPPPRAPMIGRTMGAPLGTPEAPLRVAVIGSGPSGFYAAEHLQEQDHLEVQIDARPPADALRAGARRGRTARPPEDQVGHPGLRQDRRPPSSASTATSEMGRDLTHADLSAYYHAISTRSARAPTGGWGSAQAAGSHSATELIAGWYNAHPDFAHLGFDLSTHDAASGRQRQRGDGPGAHPRQLARGAGPDRHRRARAGTHASRSNITRSSW